jgi:Iap family predicted aminopeptidase
VIEASANEIVPGREPRRAVEQARDIVLGGDLEASVSPQPTPVSISNMKPM